MVGNTKELSCISAITLDYLAIYLGHLRYRLLMIQGSSFLVCIYIPDGDLLYYI